MSVLILRTSRDPADGTQDLEMERVSWLIQVGNKITRSESVVGGRMEMRVWSYVNKGSQA